MKEQLMKKPLEELIGILQSTQTLNLKRVHSEKSIEQYKKNTFYSLLKDTKTENVQSKVNLT